MLASTHEDLQPATRLRALSPYYAPLRATGRTRPVLVSLTSTQAVGKTSASAPEKHTHNLKLPCSSPLTPVDGKYTVNEGSVIHMNAQNKTPPPPPEPRYIDEGHGFGASSWVVAVLFGSVGGVFAGLMLWRMFA